MFSNTISKENAKASFTPDMKERKKITGDTLESILHGLSLFKSKFTPKEMPGIHKEDLLEAQGKIIDEAERRLVGAGFHRISERLLANGVRDGAGIRQLIDNLADISENYMPEDEAQRTAVAGILDDLMNGLAETTQNMQGSISQRLGNEIMIG